MPLIACLLGLRPVKCGLRPGISVLAGPVKIVKLIFVKKSTLRNVLQYSWIFLEAEMRLWRRVLRNGKVKRRDTRQVCIWARAWRRRQGQDMRKLPGGVEHCRLRAQRAAAAIRSQSLPSRWSSTAGSTARDGSPTHHRTRGTCENLGSRQKGGGQMRTLCQATIQQRSVPQSNQSLRRPRRLKRICACLLRFPRAGGQSRIMKRKHEPGPHPTFTERYGSRTGSIVQKTRVSY